MFKSILLIILSLQVGILISCSKSKFTSPVAPDLEVQPVGCGDAEFKVSWTPPTTRADGSPLNDLYGYIIYWGLDSRSNVGTYSDSLTIIDNAITTYTVPVTDPDVKLYVAMKAMDSANRISTYSEEITKQVPAKCKPGEKPNEKPKPEDDVYKKPAWCKDTVWLKYQWPKQKYVTSFEVKLGYRKNQPSELFNLDKTETWFKAEVKRGQKVYVSLKANKRGSSYSSSGEVLIQTLTCEELEFKIGKNKRFKEKLTIDLKL